MKKLFTLLLLTSSFAQAQDWKVVPGKITTPWSEKVTPDSVLPEYPRPQFVRESWKSMNGLWDYVITPRSASLPAAYQGKILVPFAIESAMSGVGKTVGKDSLLWYHTSFTMPAFKKGNRTLLHFGAVDWQMTLYINGQEVGSHRGGFDPFSFDITGFLKKTKTQEMVVRVWDPTDQGTQPRGKQVRKPEGIWYTPVTGIWQTVWLESVPVTYIASTKQTPDIDQQTLTVSTTIVNPVPGDKVRVSVWNGTDMISEESVEPGATAVLKIPNMKLWSPEDPFLYDLRYAIVRKEKPVDEAQSYFAMRKTSIGKDNNGVLRMLLNNKFVFQYGPLDQGWWPDGLYTAPTDEALKFDVEKTKEMGFNMIRKHIKVEPARWYYHCDKLGMLVWQDMPSGDLGNRWEPRPGIVGRGTEQKRSNESERAYREEWNAIMEALHNVPSIVVWVPFNEAWGQFKTTEITEWTMQKDPSRLVNSASGGNFFLTGHIIDLHNYPDPAMPQPDIYGAKQAIVLGEFGGLGLPVDGHVWQQKDNWGYQSFKTPEELFKRYSTFTDRLEDLIRQGLSAAVYTQTTDVEVEINGLMTYDRKVIKNPLASFYEVNKKLYNPALVVIKP
ncbi:glycoside hydrolase family 2 protein [Chitinophaga niabensis]|uniref:Glycosyl hydrolases family 2 n=1 Tax=Chitinophaga niabensis TaxID=536979 RepID=A0A1N6DG86_9BACT|nr:sugar-binding domain-containing protein [Chitinophaga niabensis]SIN69703.1 Glycosyl hydrolases family 2 [Chitinophaga niabensis]